jgi:ketosteroid isomerase-like protein
MMPDKGSDAITEAIKERLNDYRDASLSLDAEKCLDCFARTEAPVMAADGKLLIGWDAHVEFFREGMKALKNADYFRFKNVHVYPLAADAAVCSVEFEWSFGLTSGEQLRSEGAWTYTFKYTAGAWRIVHSGGAHVFLSGAETTTAG